MSIYKILNSTLREKGFTDDQISAVEDVIRDVHVVPYDRLAEVVTKRRELELSEQENLAKLDQLRAERDSMHAEISMLRSELKTASLRHAVETALMKAGVRNPSFVMRGLDMGSIQQADDGSLTGIDEQIESLRKSDGYMFLPEAAPAAAPATAGNEANQVTIHGLNPVADRTPAPVQTNETVTDMDALYTLIAHRSMPQWR